MQPIYQAKKTDHILVIVSYDKVVKNYAGNVVVVLRNYSGCFKINRNCVVSSGKWCTSCFVTIISELRGKSAG